MANKLDRIDKDIEKTRAKIAEYQKQLKELEAQKTEQENLQIIQQVRALNLTREQLSAFLRGAMEPPASRGKDGTPVSLEEKEGNAYEDSDER